MLRLNGNVVTPTIFPDKTSQVWKLPEEVFKSNKCRIDWNFESEAEIFHLAQLQDLLLTKNHNMQTELMVWYLPYGRQDKNIANDATFALQTFLKIVRNLNFHRMIILDPHNLDAVRPGCAVQSVFPFDELREAILNTNTTLACYPDKGAVSKYKDVYVQEIGDAYIYGEKVRDQLTGNITHYEVIGDCKGKSVMIVDDICDGGMTFKILAKDLLAKGATEVNLFVTHGIFSRGLKTLKEAGINRIFTHEGEKSDI